MGREEVEERRYVIRVGVFSVESWGVTASSLRGALELVASGKAEMIRPERVEPLPEVGECGILGAEELEGDVWRTIPPEEIRVAAQEATLPPSGKTLDDMVARLTHAAPDVPDSEEDPG